MTTELASRKWWTFLTFFSGYITREFNLWCMGTIRRSAMLYRKWYERPSALSNGRKLTHPSGTSRAGSLPKRSGICRVTFCVTGLIPLLFLARVKDSRVIAEKGASQWHDS
jgi:hypothetical protein